MGSEDGSDSRQAEQPSLVERRAGLRYHSTQETPCHFATLERIECRWSRIHDVSESGIALLVPYQFAPGQELVIEIPSRNKGEVHLLPIRVVHTHVQADDLWFAGCVFTRPLSEQELQALM